MQEDGNLVLRCRREAIWSTHTHGESVRGGLVLGIDGTLTIYSTDGSPLWSANENNENVNYLRVENNGNLVLYDSNMNHLWSSETAGSCDSAFIRIN